MSSDNAGKVVIVEPYTKEWHEEAYRLLRSYAQVRPCRDCGHPHITQYRCTFCGSVDP